MRDWGNVLEWNRTLEGAPMLIWFVALVITERKKGEHLVKKFRSKNKIDLPASVLRVHSYILISLKEKKENIW